MNKLYTKSELIFAITFIVIYVVGASLCDTLSSMVGIDKVFTLPFLLALAIIFYVWIHKNGLNTKYGLCKPHCTSRQHLYYIPLLLIISTNIWLGVAINHTIVGAILYTLTMLCVGFVEEIIFRGFLFRALEKDSVTSAIAISSITFGIGHIINLFSNGLDHILPSICQVCYAMAVGLLFVIIFYKGGSLIPCIITHSMVNALSVFQNTNALTPTLEIAISIAIIIISLVYTLILTKTLKADDNK